MAQSLAHRLHRIQFTELPFGLASSLIRIHALCDQLIHLGSQVKVQFVIYIRSHIRSQQPRIAAPKRGPFHQLSSTTGGRVAPSTLPTAAA